MRTFLVVNTNGTYRTFSAREKTSTLKQLQEAVGGYIEGVDLPKDNLRLYVNEEGKLDGLPENVVGTSLFTRSYPGVFDIIAGNMVVLNIECDDEGYDLGLDERQISWLVSRYGLVEEA